MDQVWQSLAASGPMALVLGVAVYTLWRDNREIRAELREARAEHRKDILGLINDLEDDA